MSTETTFLVLALGVLVVGLPIALAVQAILDRGRSPAGRDHKDVPGSGSTTTMQCPKCKLENPSSAAVCDCGHEFAPEARTRSAEPVSATTSGSGADNLFCQIAIGLGYIAQAQADAALQAQRVEAAIGRPTRPVGAHLYDQSQITKEQVAAVLRVQDRLGSAVGATPSTGRLAQAGVLVCPSCGSVCDRGRMDCPQCGARVQTSVLSHHDAPESRSDRSRTVYILLALFLGGIGIHNFYAGRGGAGVFQIILGLVSGILLAVAEKDQGASAALFGALGIVVLFIWVLIEIVAVTRDGDGRRFV